jgi:hypothetical protein
MSKWPRMDASSAHPQELGLQTCCCLLLHFAYIHPSRPLFAFLSLLDLIAR